MSLSAVAYRKHPQHSDTGYNKWLELCGGSVYTITVAVLAGAMAGQLPGDRLQLDIKFQAELPRKPTTWPYSNWTQGASIAKSFSRWRAKFVLS
jgi:hypothetical protein